MTKNVFPLLDSHWYNNAIVLRLHEEKEATADQEEGISATADWLTLAALFHTNACCISRDGKRKEKEKFRSISFDATYLDRWCLPVGISYISLFVYFICERDGCSDVPREKQGRLGRIGRNEGLFRESRPLYPSCALSCYYGVRLDDLSFRSHSGARTLASYFPLNYSHQAPSPSNFHDYLMRMI